MITVAEHRVPVAPPLAPVTAALQEMFGTDDLPCLAPGLFVPDAWGWSPATELISGARLGKLLETAARIWKGPPHACAALAWKSYCYWVALPAVIGWASARRVPLLDPADVVVDLSKRGALPTLGLRDSVTVAVLPSDPLAVTARAGVRVAADEAELLALLRASLLDAHLAPLLDAIQARVRVGGRTLLGSVASGIAHGILQAADTLPGPSVQSIDTLLTALGVDDLIELVPGPNGQPTVQRKTCCLAFTLPEPRYCRGCCVRRPS